MTEKYSVYFHHGTQNDFEVARKSKVQALFDECCHYLHIEESDYFSLYVTDAKGKVIWLNTEKSIRKQVIGTARDNIHFGVKYYHMDPTQLYSEETRLYFVHQVIDDIRDKQYPLSENQLNLITALYIQSELGDYEEGTNVPGYTKDFFLFEHQSPDCEDEIVAQHKAMAGKPPAQCESEILAIVRDQPLYGVHMHSGALQEGKQQHPVKIGIHPKGLRIWEDDSEQVFDLPWDKVTKFETKRRRFIVRARGKLPEKRDSSELLGQEEGDAPNPVVDEPTDTVNAEPQQAEADTGAAQDVEASEINPGSSQEPTQDNIQEPAPSVQSPTSEPAEIEPAAPVANAEDTTPPKPGKPAPKKKEPVTVFKFVIADRAYVKTIWRLAAEHHYFFNRVPEKQPRFSFVRIGSRFRYSGRTFRQTQKEFSEKKFDPIDPEVRVRMSLRRPRRQSGQGDETEDSYTGGYMKVKESFRRPKEDSLEEPDEKPDVTNEITVENNPVEVPVPGTAEAELQKEVTDKFLENELERETEKQGVDDPPPPEPLEIAPIANGDGEMADFPPPENREAAPEVTKVVETANANGDDNPAAVNEVEQ